MPGSTIVAAPAASAPPASNRFRRLTSDMPTSAASQRQTDPNRGGGTAALLRMNSRRRAPSTVLSRGQHTELVAVGIGHHHPGHLALADVDASRIQGQETVDLRLLITVVGEKVLTGLPRVPAGAGRRQAATRRARRGPVSRRRW